LFIHNLFVKIQWVNFQLLWTLCKLPQYQSFKINRKCIHLFLQHKSIWILLLKQQKEQWCAIWVTVVELVTVGYIRRQTQVSKLAPLMLSQRAFLFINVGVGSNPTPDRIF
jgi:hypothetical protein